MSRQIKILGYIIAISLFIIFIPSFGQNIIYRNDDLKLGTVLFDGNSTKLTEDAKMVLDSCVGQIQRSPLMHVKIVTFNKDHCNKCSKRSWKRTKKIVKYFSMNGILESRLLSENRLEKGMGKVEIYLTTPITDSPHPNFKKIDE